MGLRVFCPVESCLFFVLFTGGGVNPWRFEVFTSCGVPSDYLETTSILPSQDMREFEDMALHENGFRRHGQTVEPTLAPVGRTSNERGGRVDLSLGTTDIHRPVSVHGPVMPRCPHGPP